MVMKSDFSGVFEWGRVVGRSGLSDDPAVKDAPLSQVAISAAYTTVHFVGTSCSLEKQ